MRALVLEEANAPLQQKELPRPEPSKRQVLVRIEASGVNPLDTKIRAGQAAHARQPLPAVLGMDLAGTVEAVGDGVARFAPGDKVYGLAGGIGGLQGSLADYVAVDADLLARRPSTLSSREAAALPLVFITAWEGLVDRANVRPGQTVLVHGGAGGVGHVAIQLALARGARVFATGRTAQQETIRRLGATPIDHTVETVAQYVQRLTDGQGFDIVYDTVGGPVLDDSFEAVRTYTGHVVSSLGWGTHRLAPLSFRAATYSGVFTLLAMITGQGRAHHGEILAEATRLAEAGQLAPLMDARRFRFDDADTAQQIVAAGQAQGRVVVEMNGSPA
jgi:NADPH:quinone reductase-like Zn-dependent oxidoreductase